MAFPEWCSPSVLLVVMNLRVIFFFFKPNARGPCPVRWGHGAPPMQCFLFPSFNEVTYVKHQAQIPPSSRVTGSLTTQASCSWGTAIPAAREGTCLVARCVAVVQALCFSSGFVGKLVSCFSWEQTRGQRSWKTLGVYLLKYRTQSLLRPDTAQGQRNLNTNLHPKVLAVSYGN